MQQSKRQTGGVLGGVAAVRQLASRHPRRAEFFAVVAFFGLLAALFMGPILWHFNSAVHGFWGDGTGGVTWMYWLGQPPFGEPTTMTSYPFGEDLTRPEFITAALYVLPMWLLTQLFGAVAAWNSIILLSFWLCGVSMYYLVKKVGGNPMAAVWAGTAFTYLPLHQFKAFGHIAYVMTFVFVWVLWWVINFVQKPNRKNAIILGIVAALPFYIDGYYILFTALLVGTPLLLVAVWKLRRITVASLKAAREYLKWCVVFGVTLLIALLPIAYVRLVYGAQIASNLALARGDDFLGNVKVYSARWYDYLVPIETHPVFGPAVQEFRKTYHHGSNPSEYSLYLGVVLLSLVGLAVYWLWKRREVFTAWQQRVIYLCLAIAGVAFIFSLQPVIQIGPIKIPTPSGVLSVLIQLWRVLARLVIIVDLALVVVAALALSRLLARQKKLLWRTGLFVSILALTFFEYLSFNPFYRQDIWYYKNLSSANRWLASQDDISVIAMYPLLDQPYGVASLYTTQQQVHGKRMINAGSVTDSGRRVRASLLGLKDPQTVRVLKALGAQAVVTHETPGDDSLAGLREVYSVNEAPAGYAADVEVFRIANEVTPARYALVAQEGFFDVQTINLTAQHLMESNTAVLQVQPLGGSNPSAPQRIQFRVATTSGLAGDLVIYQRGKVLATERFSENQSKDIELEVVPNEPIRLFMPAAEGKVRSVIVSSLNSIP